MPLNLEIVTPEASIYRGSVDSVELPGVQGEIGVLPMHAPLITTMNYGELRLHNAGSTTNLVVGEGLVEITGAYARILTDMAVDVESIDEAAIEQALERAKQTLDGLKPGEQQEEVAAVMASIQRCTAQLHIRRKRRAV